MPLQNVTQLGFVMTMDGRQTDVSLTLAGGQFSGGVLGNVEQAQFLAFVWQNGWSVEYDPNNKLFQINMKAPP
jgi:hypothetical protein